MARSFPPNRLPKYAQDVPANLLVQYICKGRCMKTRWLRLNKPATMEEVRMAEFGEYRATCLMCGSVMKDHYNWFRYAGSDLGYGWWSPATSRPAPCQVRFTGGSMGHADDREALLHIGTVIGIKAGILEECEAHELVSRTFNDDDQKAYEIASAMVRGGDPLVSDYPREQILDGVKDALESAGLECGLCAKYAAE